MSEEFFNQIADELRSNQAANAGAPAEIAPVPAPEPIANPEPIPEVNTEGNPEPSGQEKDWWDQQDTSVKALDGKKEEKPAFDLDDDLKLISDYKKSGKTLADFVKEYQVSEIDKWNDEKIVTEGLKQFMNLSEDELDQATREYENASVFQKKQWAENFKEKFDKKNQDMLKQLTSSQNENQVKAEAIADKYRAELDTYSNAIVNKEIYGLKVTDEMSNNLKTFIDTEFTLQKEDGSFDVEKMYSIALWLKHGPDLVKANVTKARNEGKEQVIREVTNPSKNFNSPGRGISGGLEAAQEAFNTLFPG
jgi:hypothetical protein